MGQYLGRFHQGLNLTLSKCECSPSPRRIEDFQQPCMKLKNSGNLSLGHSIPHIFKLIKVKSQKIGKKFCKCTHF